MGVFGFSEASKKDQFYLKNVLIILLAGWFRGDLRPWQSPGSPIWLSLLPFIIKDRWCWAQCALAVFHILENPFKKQSLDMAQCDVLEVWSWISSLTSFHLLFNICQVEGSGEEVECKGSLQFQALAVFHGPALNDGLLECHSYPDFPPSQRASTSWGLRLPVCFSRPQIPAGLSLAPSLPVSGEDNREELRRLHGAASSMSSFMTHVL